MSFNRTTEVERDDLEVHLAGVDLGEIQDVVDNGEQIFAGAHHRVQIFTLVEREVGLLHQAGQAEDPGQRRADLVTHVGQEG